MPRGYSDTFPDNFLSQVDYLRDYKPNPTAGGVSVPTSVDDILTSSDPLASVALGMGAGAPTPSKGWLGNEASGATEVSGSGLDLVDSSMLKEQSTFLATEGLSVTNAAADYMAYTAGSELEMGTESRFWLAIIGFTSTTPGAVARVFGDRDGTSPNEGWDVLTDSNDFYDSFIDDSVEGALAASNLSGELTADTLQVVGWQRNVTTTTITLMANNGTPVSATDASIVGASISNPTPKFGFGDISAGSGASNLVCAALFEWAGTDAEAVTSTMVANLFSSLGGT